MKKSLLITSLFSTFCLCCSLNAQPTLGLQTIASGFTKPVDIANAGDDRLFIVEQDGYIFVRQSNGTITQFLDIDSKVRSTSSEQGLLGLVFDPGYASNGYFYVYYIANAYNSVVARYNVSAGDANVADANSETILLSVAQPAGYNNHKAGDLNFGPDGYLYCALGDGGNAGDPGNRAQDKNILLGKLLRLDVDGGTPYAIPSNNPFVGVVNGADEVWAYGFRNPWRFSFDRLTGDLWTGDVGQGSWEEIDFQPAFSPGGENYGWRCYEGNHAFNTSLCNLTDPFVFPVYEYPHDFVMGGYAVTGGFVYRGNQYPAMNGYYIFCDYVSGNFWTISPNGSGGWTTVMQASLQSSVSSFGEGVDGEIYATNLATGEIYHVINVCPGVNLSFSVTNASAQTLSDGAVDLTVSGGTGPFTYNWSNGATTQDITNLSSGIYAVTATDISGCIASGSAAVNNDCGMVTNVIVSEITSSSAIISWTPVGVTSFKVIYYISPNGTKTKINTSNSSLSLTGLQSNTKYKYNVKNSCPGVSGKFKVAGKFNTLALREEEATEIAQPLIYPNPGNGIFTVKNASSLSAIHINDMAGKELFRTTHDGGEELILELSFLKDGVYLVRMENNEHIIITRKLVIE